MKLTAGAETCDAWNRYMKAKEAKSRWTAEEREAKAQLLLALGYDPDDPKPVESDVTDESGELIGGVRVGSRKGLDIKYLRAKHPDVYAECERWTYPISIRPADQD